MTNDSDSQLEEWTLDRLGRNNTPERHRVIQEFQDHWDDALYTTLIKLLNHQDEDVRCHTVEMLLRFATNESMPKILELLNDPSDVVRWHTCGCLHDFGNASAIPSLKQVTLQDPDAEVRLTACYALGRLGDLTLIPFLEDVALKDKGVGFHGHPVRQIAEMAIQEIEEHFGVFDETKRKRWYETVRSEDGTPVRKLP